jgi:hypothetical protein
MTIENQAQLENTRAKLKLLEDRCAGLKSEPSDNSYARELTLQSLQRWVKRLKEETLRYECKSSSAGKSP